MEIKLYQIDIRRNPILAFMNYERTQQLQGFAGINSDTYERVFQGNVKANSLEDVFYIFNNDHPEGYRGRSLSVSDVVEVIENQESQFYFCDDFSFKHINFDPQKTREFQPRPKFSEEEFVKMDARLGINISVTQAELDILKKQNYGSALLLTKLIQSERCVMDGDTYFPGPWNSEIFKDEQDLNFYLPEHPLKTNDYVEVPIAEPANISLWGRLGISVRVTWDELSILMKEDEHGAQKARDLLINLVHSNRCAVVGETYFPEDGQDYSFNLRDSDELTFDLPAIQLSYDPLESKKPSLSDRIQDGEAKVSAVADRKEQGREVEAER